MTFLGEVEYFWEPRSHISDQAPRWGLIPRPAGETEELSRSPREAVQPVHPRRGAVPTNPLAKGSEHTLLYLQHFVPGGRVEALP